MEMYPLPRFPQQPVPIRLVSARHYCRGETFVECHVTSGSVLQFNRRQRTTPRQKRRSESKTR